MSSITFIIILNTALPIALETGNCFLPHPDNQGYLCDWEEKDFVVRNGKMVLRYENENDNFFEKIVRKRINNGKNKKS